MKKRTFGLIGYPLSHSFSKKYFTEKFLRQGIDDAHYELFEIKSIEEFPALVEQQTSLVGLNVTIPYKQQVMAFLDHLDEIAEKVGAVNTIKFGKNGQKSGFNSDYYGFKSSLEKWIDITGIKEALVLGTGGASKAVIVVLQDLGIKPQLVSRTASQKAISYDDLRQKSLSAYPLIINTTPLGMTPKTDSFPDIAYEQLTPAHYCYDLVYNPEATTFMKKAAAQGANTKNGLEMLHLQAEKSWEIWNR
jgi:shikimate dehydrogenase